MKKVTFNHDGEKITDTLGINSDRYDVIADEIKASAVLSNNKGSDYMMECALNKVKPKNEAELFITGYIIGRVLEKYFGDK